MAVTRDNHNPQMVGFHFTKGGIHWIVWWRILLRRGVTNTLRPHRDGPFLKTCRGRGGGVFFLGAASAADIGEIW